MQKYCLDTSAFINAWVKHYCPTVFRTFWTEIDRLIGDGTVVSCHEVYREIERRDDDLLAWVKRRKQIFERPLDRTTKELTKVMAMFPNFAAQGGSINAADPWLIAHAKAGGYIVVTYEEKAPKIHARRPPKIPNACEAFGVGYMGMMDFLTTNNVQL